MSWSLDKSRKIWKCSSYSDLNYTEITNLAEYGQPYGPYEKGYDHDFYPDFSNVVIEMPQMEVMKSGFGRKITAYHFPIVHRFLNNPLPIHYGTHSFQDLVLGGVARPADRFISTNLYGTSAYGIDSGTINPGDAAYIYGSIGFALRKGSRFIYAPQFRRIEAEIGALDDNWDFESNKGAVNLANRILPSLLGPDHYNLEKPIRILFRGPGKREIIEKKITGSQGLPRTGSPSARSPVSGSK